MSKPTLWRHSKAALCAAIDDHNRTLQMTCDAQAEHCKPWTSRGRRCTECPLQYAITNELIEHVAKLNKPEGE